MRRPLSTLAAAAVLALAFAPTAGAQQITAEACPHPGLSPQPSCTNQAFSGEGWIVSAVSRPAPEKLGLYRRFVESRLGRFYAMPADPMIGFIAIRLDVPGDFGRTQDDPKQGYMESSVMLRVKNRVGGEEGWFPLATPVNDESQYSAGRFVGLPKYAADLTISHDRANDSWSTVATRVGGKAGDPATEYQRITWLPSTPAAPAPPADPALRKQLERFTYFDDPMFATVQAWDAPESGNPQDRFAERVKFTIASYVPDDGPASAPPGTYTSRGVPRFGTSLVSINDIAGGPTSFPLWRELLPNGVQRLPGMFVNANGNILVSSERADGTTGPGGTLTPTDPKAGSEIGSPGQGGPAAPGGGSTPGSGPGCRDRLAPRSTFSVRSARLTRRSLRISGRSASRGCGPLARLRVAVARELGRGRCRFLAPSGRFGAARSCARRRYLTARGTSTWSLTRRARMPRGRYRVTVLGVDRAGNVERVSLGRNSRRVLVR